MHSAKIDNSIRLQRVLKVLKDGLKHTTRDIVHKAHVLAVNSVISELRDNGYKIDCERVGQRWYYQLVK